MSRTPSEWLELVGLIMLLISVFTHKRHEKSSEALDLVGLVVLIISIFLH